MVAQGGCRRAEGRTAAPGRPTTTPFSSLQRRPSCLFFGRRHRADPRHSDVKPTDLRGILRYIPRFREKVFVLAIDGSIVTDDNFPNLLLEDVLSR